jgi:hypothetical protein
MFTVSRVGWKCYQPGYHYAVIFFDSVVRYTSKVIPLTEMPLLRLIRGSRLPLLLLTSFFFPTSGLLASYAALNLGAVAVTSSGTGTISIPLASALRHRFLNWELRGKWKFLFRGRHFFPDPCRAASGRGDC